MQKERRDTYILGTRRSISVELEIKEGNTFVDSRGQILNFDSLALCKYINKEKVFHNFLCKYSNKVLPDNLDEVGLIIDEYKKLKVDTDLDLLSANRKNKPILVQGENFNKEFGSITDTIKYFNTLNIQLDRKALYLRLKDGKFYKGYCFAYIQLDKN
jgi:hypothetical protein